MSSPWCRAWEIGSGDIFSGYCNKTLDNKISWSSWGTVEIFLDVVLFFKPWTGFVSQGNEFSYYMLICSSFILNQYDNILNISYTPAIHCSYFIMPIFLFLPAPKRLMNGLYILGYTVTAILFQTMINFGLFHFLIFIPQGTYYSIPMCIISA